MKIVKVEWMDAASQSAWRPEDDLVEPMMVETVGRKIKVAEDYIVLCASVSEENDHYGDCIAIPKGMVLKETDLA